MLDFTQVRVLGCLVEKGLSTPEYYPMSLNALKQACNQKTNRDPVTELTEAVVEDTLASLKRQRLVGTASGAGSRVLKYRHALVEAMSMSPQELSVLAVLMLRGPQTVGELRGRSARMHAFDSLEEVEQILEQLAGRDTPVVQKIERQPGQKETRYGHLLAGEPQVDVATVDAPVDGDRLAVVESAVQELRDELSTLRTAFERFRSQLE